MITSRNALVILLIATLFTQTACQALKPKKVDAKEFPPDPRERVKKNIEEGRGFRLMGGDKGGTNYEFASANPLWRATLDTLDFMPLVSANYSGGIVVTDWYSENNTPNESVKISVRFLTNEIRSDALDVKIFKKDCNAEKDCRMYEESGDLITDIKKSILKKAAIYKKKNIKPYKVPNEGGASSGNSIF